jgi:hypothetical protein
MQEARLSCYVWSRQADQNRPPNGSQAGESVRPPACCGQMRSGFSVKLNCTIVGMSEIKRRRLEELEVHCHPGTKVGEYVPFYFCPRSIMLFLLYRGNHVDLSYTGGQRPIVHLEADAKRVSAWADGNGKRWAFSHGNAGARYTEFSKDLAQLDELDWNAIGATNFKDPIVKEHKQAEFLVEESFPWNLVDRVGVIDAQMAATVTTLLSNAAHQPPVAAVPTWYY